MGCSDGDSEGNNEPATTNNEQPMCDGDDVAASQADCEAEGCVWRVGQALDPDTCNVRSDEVGNCAAPEAEIIPGPFLGIVNQTVYKFDDGAPQGTQVCPEDSSLAACDCPL